MTKFITITKPLPNGKTANLRAVAKWVEKDGRTTYKVVTPGMYEGGYYTLSDAEVASGAVAI